MKKLLLLSFFFLLFSKISCLASPTWTKGDFSISASTQLDLDTVGSYDFKNVNWLTGISKDIVVVSRKEKRFMYLSGEQLFNLSNDGKGAFGLAIGLYTGSIAQYISDGLRHLAPDAILPQWLGTIGNYLSIEGGYGYRFLGTPDGQNPNVMTIGGKVKIPIEKLWSK